MVHALLLETDAGGRFSHLELARADGLWTLHPEPDGTLHGNHVERGEPGVRHIVGLPFSPDDVVVVAGSTISLAALAWGQAGSIAEGGIADLGGVVIRAGGQLDAVSDLRLERLSLTAWRVGEGRAFEIDATGFPVLEGGEMRPLEQV